MPFKAFFIGSLIVGTGATRSGISIGRANCKQTLSRKKIFTKKISGLARANPGCVLAPSLLFCSSAKIELQGKGSSNEDNYLTDGKNILFQGSSSSSACQASSSEEINKFEGKGLYHERNGECSTSAKIKLQGKVHNFQGSSSSSACQASSSAKGNLIVSGGIDRREFEGKSFLDLIGKFRLKLSLKVQTGLGLDFAMTAIPRDASLPTTRVLKVAVPPNQRMREFRIFQGERPLANDNYFLGSVPYMAAAGPCELVLMASFSIDVYGRLRIDVLNKDSGQKSSFIFPNGMIFDDELVTFAINDFMVNFVNDWAHTKKVMDKKDKDEDLDGLYDD